MLRRRLTVGLMAAGLLFTGGRVRRSARNRDHPPEGLRRDLRRYSFPAPTCPEEGPLYTITTTSNLVEHETVFDDGRVHATFTQTGTSSRCRWKTRVCRATPARSRSGEASTPTATTVNGTFTFNLRGTGSDGSTINTHQVEHFNVRPDGTVNEFFHCH